MDGLRHVRVGLIIGFLTVLFGIIWIVYVTTNHEDIEKGFEEVIKARVAAESLPAAEVHSHSPGGDDHAYGPENIEELVEEAHEMLIRGHLHAMGLGVLTVCGSLVLAFLNATGVTRFFGSIFLAVGGFLYPLNWIMLGYRAPAIGMEAAEKSILPVVGISIVLVVIGLLSVLYSLLTKGFSRG